MKINNLLCIPIVLFCFWSCNQKTNSTAKSVVKNYNYSTLSFDKLAQSNVDNFFMQNVDSNILVQDDYFVWGNSVVEFDGKFHAYYSRWKAKDKFKGWLTECEIVHAVSNSSEGPFKFQNIVLESDKTRGWDINNSHNPYAIVSDGKINLYYISNDIKEQITADNGAILSPSSKWFDDNRKLIRNSQRIGVATANHPNGPFTRQEKPVVIPDNINFKNIAVNPSIVYNNGIYTMIMKSDDISKKEWFRIQLVGTSKSPTGPFTFTPKPVYDKAQTEDACVWYDQNIKSYFMVCHVLGENELALFYSANGTDWQPHERSIFMKKEFTLKDGTVWTPERVERPFVLTDKTGKPTMLYVAVLDKNISGNIALPIQFN
ncbi:hypothetical protein EI427_17740 [Flammeovirga pectinis]|uniref:Glycosyl hydrolase family 43 n=1 Tax=Flammeovirga pectinis TaxID=2494373 RepID=A0A3S9P713_9BACT|nr:glycoside hydrolase family protein [Flammeovirga pectinis]AZQ64000.1 hypothetical protein EI427_17740 [Flammeovirga pectinis]